MSLTALYYVYSVGTRYNVYRFNTQRNHKKRWKGGNFKTYKKVPPTMKWREILMKMKIKTIILLGNPIIHSYLYNKYSKYGITSAYASLDDCLITMRDNKTWAYDWCRGELASCCIFDFWGSLSRKLFRIALCYQTLILLYFTLHKYPLGCNYHNIYVLN